MNHKKSIKLAAFLLSGMMVTQGTTGIIPGLKQSSMLDNTSLSASALEHVSDHYYSSPRDWDDDNNDDKDDIYSNSSYKFNLNKKNKTAQITEVINKNSTLVIPATINYNGTNYNVVSLGAIGYSSLKEVTIPTTVTTLKNNAFNNAHKLTTVKFKGNKSGLTKLYESCFSDDCPFISNQYKANNFTLKGSTNSVSFAVVGDCLIKFINYKNPDCYSYAETIKPENNTTYDNIKYFSSEAFYMCYKLKTIYLPQKFESGNESSFPGSLENIMYWKSNRFYNLSDNIKLDTFSSEAKKVVGSTIIPDNSQIGKNLSLYLVKDILDDLNISYKGSVCEEYDAWKQYQIVNTLYKYVQANYYHYNCYRDSKSPSYLDEMVSIELLGKTAKNSCGIKCTDFASLFKELCIGAGINVDKVHSYDHCYNAVKLGDKWFNIDACWQQSPECFLTTDSVIKSHGNPLSHTPMEKRTYSCDTSLGDVNGDKKIDSEDAQLILTAYTDLLAEHKPKLTPLQMVLCDVDRSGSIDSADANLVLSYYSEIELGKYDKNFEQYYRKIFGNFN